MKAAGGQGSSRPALLGEHLLLATVWPVKLPKGKAVLSDGLLASLGGSAAVGASLLIFKVKLTVHHAMPAVLDTRQRTVPVVRQADAASMASEPEDEASFRPGGRFVLPGVSNRWYLSCCLELLCLLQVPDLNAVANRPAALRHAPAAGQDGSTNTQASSRCF